MIKIKELEKDITFILSPDKAADLWLKLHEKANPTNSMFMPLYTQSKLISESEANLYYELTKALTMTARIVTYTEPNTPN